MMAQVNKCKQHLNNKTRKPETINIKLILKTKNKIGVTSTRWLAESASLAMNQIGAPHE